MSELAEEGVENAAVRAAVEAFASGSGKAGDGGSIEVLRQCMHGNLLRDVTGSDLRMSADGTSLEAGSTIRIATTQDPDGGSALIRSPARQRSRGHVRRRRRPSRWCSPASKS